MSVSKNPSPDFYDHDRSAVSAASNGAEAERRRIELMVQSDIQSALGDGVTELDDRARHALVMQACSRAHGSPPFEPAVNSVHAAIQNTIDSCVKRLSALEQMEVTMQQALRHARPMVPLPAPLDLVYRLAWIAFCILAFGPTIYTVIVRMTPDPLLAGGASFLVALASGVAILSLALDDFAFEAKSLGPAVLLAAGFCALRYSLSAGVLASVAYLLIDLAILFALGHLGEGRRRILSEHRMAEEEQLPFKTQLERCQQERAVLERRMRDAEAEKRDIANSAISAAEMAERLGGLAQGFIELCLQKNQARRLGRDHLEIIDGIRARQRGGGHPNN